MERVKLFIDILIGLDLIFMYRNGSIEIQFDDEISYIEPEMSVEEFINFIHEKLNTK